MNLKENIYPTPFKELNDLLCGGFTSGSLVVVGGASGMGKTSFLVTLLQNWLDVNVSVISLEQSTEDFFTLMKACGSEVSLRKILTLQLNGLDFQKVLEFSKRANGSCLSISDNKEDLWKTIKESIDSGCKIIIIDSLQRMANKIDIYQEMSLIVNRLREISIKNDVCIIVTSQINRKILERTGHTPLISDLRDTGYIEECADQILMLLRRDYYDPHDKPGQAELILAKNRYGNTGQIQLAFRKEISNFVGLYSPPKPVIEPSKE